MADLLVPHELDEMAVLSIDPRLIEFLDRELGEAVVEEIKFYPFLIECEILW